MIGKRNLRALLLTLCLFSHAAAFASGAPSSQFGFKGWPYRQSDSCAVTICPKKTPPAPTEVPTPEPTVTPAQTDVPTHTAQEKTSGTKYPPEENNVTPHD